MFGFAYFLDQFVNFPYMDLLYTVKTDFKFKKYSMDIKYDKEWIKNNRLSDFHLYKRKLNGVIAKNLNRVSP
jgi:hypothetical protein